MNKKFELPAVECEPWVLFVWGCLTATFGTAYGNSYIFSGATERFGIHISLVGLVAPGFFWAFMALKTLQKRIEDLEKKVGGR